ncbi:cupin-like domain-containing protein [Cyanobium sp. FGCU-52]|nr:cupin-like domain-containing protein [Cyanobium sp. FGCU52]
MKLHQIPSLPRISADNLSKWLAEGQSPLVVTEMMAGWPAMETWNFDWFARHFGDFPVEAHAPQFPPLAHCAVSTTLSNYLAYLANPVNIDASWIKGSLDRLLASTHTLYAGNFNPAHPVHGRPELVFEHVPAKPDFIESWLDLLEPEFRAAACRVQSHHFVYLSIAGGITPLHHDFWDTHAFLAQVRGMKRAVLFAPAHMDRLYRHPTRDLPEIMADPAFADVAGWEAILEPGHLLVIPSQWLHWVETLTPSITYSMDWIDASNWRSYVKLGTEMLRELDLWR